MILDSSERTFSDRTTATRKSHFLDYLFVTLPFLINQIAYLYTASQPPLQQRWRYIVRARPAESTETEAKGLLPSSNPITLRMDAVINERNVSARV